MSEKPLMDYTLAEVKAICTQFYKEHDGERWFCDVCPFKAVGNDNCVWRLNPFNWDKPRVTAAERDLLRLTGAKFVSRDARGVRNDAVYLWPFRPDLQDNGTFRLSIQPGATAANRLSATLFPSVPPGVCWEVAELLGEGEAEHG